jgi:hypothetical protein
MPTPIATADDIRLYLGTLSSAQEAVVESLITGSIGAMGAYCNRDFISSQRTEFRDGNGAARMLAVGYPITAFSSLVIDGRQIPASFQGSPGYFFSNRAIVLIGGQRFTPGLRNVVMTYTAGYGDEVPWPADLKMASVMYVTTRLRERDRLGVGSKSLAGESISYTDGPSGTSSGSQGIPSAAKTVLTNYMNTVPEIGA